MSWEAWGDPPEDSSEWVDCEYCAADPGGNGSFYCEECEGQGGCYREIDDYYPEDDY